MLLVAAFLLPTTLFAEDEPKSEMVLGKASKTMPAVLFTHEKHTERADCTDCHLEKDGDLSRKFLNIDEVLPGKRRTAMHTACTACHVKMSKGPVLVQCRVCHSFGAESAKKAGR